MKHLKFAVALILSLIVLQGCSVLKPSSSLQTPDIQYNSFRVTDLGTDGATLVFEFDVHNPNRRDISAEAYEYALMVQDRELLKGESTETLTITGRSNSTIEIPVRFTYRQLGSTLHSMSRNDSIAYDLKTNITFDIPVLGKRNVPVHAKGMLPSIELPRIRFAGYKINQLSFSGADITVSFSIQNPNSFGFTMKSLKYTIDLLGDEVVNSTLDEQLRIEAGANEEISFNLKLNSAQVGRSAMQLMMGNSVISYKFSGTGDVSADIPDLKGNIKVPFEQSGEFSVN